MYPHIYICVWYRFRGWYIIAGVKQSEKCYLFNTVKCFFTLTYTADARMLKKINLKFIAVIRDVERLVKLVPVYMTGCIFKR